MVKSPQRKGIVTLQDVANALLYFEGGSLAKELRRAGLDMTPSAFIQRRHQLNSGVFQDVLAAFGVQDMDYETFQGYRVCAVDGSSVNIARDPNAKTFVQHSGAPKGYNQVKVHAIYDVLSKMYLSAEIHPQPEQDEIGALEFLLTWYDIAGKVLLGFMGILKNQPFLRGTFNHLLVLIGGLVGAKIDRLPHILRLGKHIRNRVARPVIRPGHIRFALARSPPLPGEVIGGALYLIYHQDFGNRLRAFSLRA